MDGNSRGHSGPRGGGAPALRQHRFFVKDMVGYFGIAGNASQRANAFVSAVGINPYQPGPLCVGNPVRLVSSFRRRIVAFRDSCLPGSLGQRPD
ncbi:hypothetical protein [Paenarthrobacter sp. PH39-S1]|uniref:hypothetical protein n=1 Tax=Paenarthrobacter sp. PH39-S1 TaxID=3046204 RepID=UPI0024B903D9|nr:hypothetical protein [Paenarthrobacter sp. PH39-S1]MDJ0357095.1 hypothetical protein [Paenarthrobacter sp. PH39-S1]